MDEALADDVENKINIGLLQIGQGTAYIIGCYITCQAFLYQTTTAQNGVLTSKEKFQCVCKKWMPYLNVLMVLILLSCLLIFLSHPNGLRRCLGFRQRQPQQQAPRVPRKILLGFIIGFYIVLMVFVFGTMFVSANLCGHYFQVVLSERHVEL